MKMSEPLKEGSQLETVTPYECRALTVKNRHIIALPLVATPLEVQVVFKFKN